MTNEKGQALVEFAVVLPVLMAFLLGIVDFSLAFYTMNSLTAAARAAVRVAAVRTPAPSDETGQATGGTFIATTIAGNLYNGVDKSAVGYSLQVLNPQTGASTGQPALPGNDIKLTLTLPNFHMWTGFRPTLTGTASMRYE